MNIMTIQLAQLTMINTDRIRFSLIIFIALSIILLGLSVVLFFKLNIRKAILIRKRNKNTIKLKCVPPKFNEQNQKKIQNSKQKVTAPLKAGSNETMPLNAGSDETTPLTSGSSETVPLNAGSDETTPLTSGYSETVPLNAGSDETVPLTLGGDETIPLYTESETILQDKNKTEQLGKETAVLKQNDLQFTVDKSIEILSLKS